VRGLWKGKRKMECKKEEKGKEKIIKKKRDKR